MTVKNYTAYGESVSVMLVTSSGADPEMGDVFRVEFCDTKTGKAQSSIDESAGLVFGPNTNRAIDEMADDYLKAESADWEAYVAQSGR